MSEKINIPFDKLIQIIAPLGVFLITVIVGWIVRNIIISRLRSWSEKTNLAMRLFPQSKAR